MLRKPFTQRHSSAPGILALRYALVGRRFILGGSDGVSPRDAAQTNLVTRLALYEECVLGVRRGLLNELQRPALPSRRASMTATLLVAWLRRPHCQVSLCDDGDTVAHVFGVLEPAGLDVQRGTRRVTQ